MRQWPPHHRRLQRELRLAQPRQAVAGARPEGPGDLERARALCAVGGRAGGEQPPRRAASPGPGLRLVRSAQAVAGLLLDLRLRPDGPEGDGRRLRRDHPGDRRRDERHRRARRRAGQMRRADRRLHRRPLCRVLDRRVSRACERRGRRPHRRADARARRWRSRRCRPASTSAPARNPRKLGSAHPRNAPYQAFNA